MMDPLFRNSANAQGSAKQLYTGGGQEVAQLVCKDVVVMLVVKNLMSLPTYLLTTGTQSRTSIMRMRSKIMTMWLLPNDMFFLQGPVGWMMMDWVITLSICQEILKPRKDWMLLM